MKQKLMGILKLYPYLFYIFFLYNAVMSMVYVNNGSIAQWIHSLAWTLLSYFFYMNSLKHSQNIVHNVTIQVANKEELKEAFDHTIENMNKRGVM